MPLTIRPTEATLGAILTNVNLAALDDLTWREVEDGCRRRGAMTEGVYLLLIADEGAFSVHGEGGVNLSQLPNVRVG